jgi:hypothetical protein
MDWTLGLTRTATAAYLLITGASVALGQSTDSCSLQPVSTTQRLVLHCQGISITTERDARFQLIDRNTDGKIDGVSLQGKAMLLDVNRGRIKNGFEVITPQAIAAVRGTRWAVDVGGGKTSVFVLRGRVSVRRADVRIGVDLARGEGVDVDSGDQPLVIKRWPPARVSALMGRLER